MSQQFYGDLFLPWSVISKSVDTASPLSQNKTLQEHETRDAQVKTKAT